jgi:hypothetical protein
MADLKKFLKTPLNRKGTTQEYLDFTIARELLYGNKKKVVIDGNTYPLIRSEANLMEAEYLLEKKPDPRVTGEASGGAVKKNYAYGGRVAKMSSEKS